MGKKLIIALFLCCGSAGMALAQSGAAGEVAKAVEQLRLAMISGNKADLEKITADQLSYGHSGGKVEDRTEFVNNIVSGKSDFVTIDLTGQTIAVSGNTALVRHRLQATTNDSGHPGTVTLDILLVWQKQKGHWKLLARQAVKPH